jgi:iron(III) transport system substrate-binding protein
VGDAFTAKYGVKYAFIRMGSTQLEQRYSTEAESGNIAADMMINAGGAPAFTQEGIKKGWTEALSQAGLPVIKSGEFPARFVTGPTAIVGISPWLIAYHTGSVKGSDVPKDWPDLLDAKWKGRIMLSNPSVSDAYVDFWGLLYDRYGDSFFTLLRPNLRPVATGVQAAQGLGAGEGSFLVPAVIAQVQEPKSRGAPVDTVILPFTTGVEQHIVLTLRTKAKHPNAARLFANFVMSPEGNKLFNDDPGGFTIYEPNKLPKEYQSPKPGAAARREAITKLLGF